jgi:hypothetical protein
VLLIFGLLLHCCPSRSWDRKLIRHSWSHWLLTVLNRIIGVRDTTPSWCVVRDCVWPGAPAIQLVSRRNASVQFPFPMQHSAMGKVLQADMQLSSRSPGMLVLPNLSAMERLTQSYMLKQKLLNCEPIDLSRFVVDLRDRCLEFWTPFSDGHPRGRNSKTLTYHCSYAPSPVPLISLAFFGLVTGFFQSFRSDAHQRHI